MAVTMADISHLRKMSGAGMMDCKNALTETDGDFDKAMEIIRKKGQAVAAKRSDREASEGCVLAKTEGGFSAILALKCETDFVAKNSDFIALTQEILDLAIGSKCTTLDEVKALSFRNSTVEATVTERSGITGEKMEMDGYCFVEGKTNYAYIHPGNKLASIVALNQIVDPSIAKDVAMQIAAMNPISVDSKGIPASILAQELEIAADKARQEGKPENLIERIAQGRIVKFYKEACLLEQEFIKDNKISIEQYLEQQSKGLTVCDFKRFTLNME